MSSESQSGVVSLLIFLVLSAQAKTLELNEFARYVASFKADYQRINKAPLFIGQLTIEFSELINNQTAGTCFRNGHRRIGVKKLGFEKKSEDEKEMLLYHELGHCLLDAEHEETGIMKAMFSKRDIENYRRNKEEYKKVFFLNHKLPEPQIVYEGEEDGW